MNTLENRIAPQSVKPSRIPLTLRCFWAPLVAVLVLAAWPAFTEEPDDVYLRIMATLQKADMLAANNQPDKALAKYKEAQTALEKFKITYPDTEAKAVTYRLNYASERIASLSSASTSPSSGAAAAGVAKVGATEVKLLEAGAEPRAVLRLHPKPGDKQTLSMTMKTAMSMKMGEMPDQTTKLPAMVLSMDTTIKSVADNGDITYDILMGDATISDDPDVMPMVAQAMKSTLGKMKGLAGTVTVSNRGVVKSTEIQMPADADPQTKQTTQQMKDSLVQIAGQLPEEAVGVGAKWTATMPLKSQGMSMTQAATYELTSMEGDHLGAKLALTQTAANQKIQSPAMPGMKVDLTKMTGTGSGEITWDLSQLLPSASSLTQHTDMALGMNVGGQKQSMNMGMDMNLQMEAK